MLLACLLAAMPACDAKEPPLPAAPAVVMPPPAEGQLQPDPDRPMFWRYRGQPLILLGGSVEDNLFQLTADVLDPHLDLLVSVGGNYVRCTMSPRDEGNVQPHAQRSDGRYDLDAWSDEYWQRFEHFLDATAARGIIVQIELWDRFDLANEPWRKSSWNPANNVTWTTADTRLEPVYDNHPGRLRHPFFHSVPALDDNPLLLKHQQRYVDRLLEATLRHDHVLYCMDNETHVPAEWGEYWATYIQRKAADAGRRVYCTQMWDPWDLTHAMHRRTTDRPDLYAFVEVSQNNHMKGEAHFSLLMNARQRILDSGQPRPLNSVKVYGADTGKFGDGREGALRLWRCLLGGAAAVRFHRPTSGLGLGELAQTHLKAARMFTQAYDLTTARPTWEPFTKDRAANEAFASVRDTAAGPVHAILFPGKGDLTLQLPARDRWQVRWLDIAAATWHDPVSLTPDGRALQLTTPSGEGPWLALVEP